MSSAISPAVWLLPGFRRKSIEAHAPNHRVRRPGRLPHRLVNPEVRRTACRYRTIEIQAGPRTINAADPVPGDLRQALEAITQPGARQFGGRPVMKGKEPSDR